MCSKPEGHPQNRVLRSESYSELPKPMLRAYFSMRMASVQTPATGSGVLGATFISHQLVTKFGVHIHTHTHTIGFISLENTD